MKKEKLKKEKKTKKEKEVPQNNKYHKFLWSLIIYSLIGFVFELIYSLISANIFHRGSGLLLGPICFIYGILAMIEIKLLGKLKGHNLILFVCGTVIGAVSQYLIHFILEATIGIKIWNWTYSIFNLNGRACIEYSILCGIACVLLINKIQIWVEKLIDKTEGKYTKIVDIIVTIIIVAEIMLSLWGLTIYGIRAKETVNGKNYISNNNAIEKFQNEVFSNEIMEKIFPRLEIVDKNNQTVLVRELNNI